jgi:uncharacterized protein
MKTFRLAGLPADLEWRREPKEWEVREDGSLSIAAAGRTDLFNDPGTGAGNDTAPAALFPPPDGAFSLSARVGVAFGSTFDAGVLQEWVRDDIWAKLCFELSPQGQPMIVSVVTRGVSDDCNSVVISAPSVFLRVSQLVHSTAFHYSLDGKSWIFVRHFSLGSIDGLRVGFSSQSPTGPGCRSVFSDVRCTAGALTDLRSGE